MSKTTPPFWVLALLAKELTTIEFRVWAYLSWRRGKNESAWPLQATIANELGLSERSVQRAIRKLERKGWLGVKRPDHTSRNCSFEYLIHGPERTTESDPIPPGTGGTESPDEGGTGDRSSGHRVTNVPVPLNEEHSQLTHLSEHSFRLAELLRDLILQRLPKNRARQAKMATWAEHIDKLIRIDDRTREEVERVIRWCQADSFWQSNILSASKLRDKFDQLEAKMRASQPTEPAAPPVERGADGMTPRERAMQGTIS